MVQEISNSDYLRLFTDLEILEAVKRSEYLEPILAEYIKNSINDMDEEVQPLFRDLNNDTIVINAHIDTYGAMDTLAFLLDNGYLAEVAFTVAEDRGDW